MAVSRDRLEQYVTVVQLFAARLVLFHQKVAERLGLTATEFKSLRLLEQLGPLSLSELAQETGLQLGTMSGLVDKLVSNGLITRARDPADKRKIVLAASPEAAARATAFYRDQGSSMATLLARYSSREFQAVIMFLGDASEVLAQSTAQLDRTLPSSGIELAGPCRTSR